MRQVIRTLGRTRPMPHGTPPPPPPYDKECLPSGGQLHAGASFSVAG